MSDFKGTFLATSPLLVFFALMIWIAFYIMPINLNLSDSNKAIGTIASISKEVDHSNRSLGLSSLVIHLQGLPSGFWIYRTLQNYNGLTSRLKMGQSVVIYHSTAIHNGNYEIYQLESGSATIYSFKEYKWKERMGSIRMLAVLLVFFRLTFWRVYKAAFKPPAKRLRKHIS